MNSACLDPVNNQAPAAPEHIHLIGICGTAMAALAGMLKERGFLVSGSDQNIYPPMSDFLAAQHIPVQQGFRAEHLHPRPDLVLIGNVVRATNPEAIATARLGLPYLSMPQALAHFFLQGKMPLVVSGTHGKTTTASLLASTLLRMGEAPGFMIGGIVEAFGRNYNVNDSRYFVVEGDEYDTAFFNKVSKFHHYRPQCAICTSVEFDHADIFPDLASIERTFAEFFGRIPPDGALIANGDDPVLRKLLTAAQCRLISYGTGEHCLWQLHDVHAQDLHSEFSFSYQGEMQGSCHLPMPGQHNCLNALAVIALLHHLGFPLARILPAMASFEGVKRRQQIRGVVRNITVVDDFAHHPTAVRATLDALRQTWPNSRLLVVFEPRTNSSRRAVFQQDYAQSFALADQILIRQALPLEGFAATEQFSSARLAKDLRTQGLNAQDFATTDEIIDHLAAQCQSGDKVVILSNGGFDNIHTRLLQRLQDETCQGPHTHGPEMP